MHSMKPVTLDISPFLPLNPGDTNTTAVSLQAGDPKYELAATKGQAFSCDVSWLTVKTDKLQG